MDLLLSSIFHEGKEGSNYLVPMRNDEFVTPFHFS